MAAVACSCRGLPCPVDKSVESNSFVGALVDLIRRPGERVALDALSELLAEACRTRVIREKDDVAGTGQQIVVPAQSPVIPPHAVWSTVHQDKQGIFLVLVEV